MDRSSVLNKLPDSLFNYSIILLGPPRVAVGPGVVLPCPLGCRHEVDHLVVAVVPEVHLVEVVELEDPLPLVRPWGGRRSSPWRSDHEAVAGLGPRQAEVSVLQLQHRLQEIGLELKPLGLGQKAKTDLM